MANVLRCSVPPLNDIKSAIVHAGFTVSQSHTEPHSIKTNAPVSLLWDIFREWVKQTDGGKRLKEGSPGSHILKRAIQYVY